MNADSWLTMVALRKPVLPALDDVFALVHGPASITAEVTETRTGSHSSTCRWGEAAVGITLVERPIPASLLEGPCANAWYWPDASEAVRQHAAHLLIHLVDESRDTLEKVLRLTALTSAVAQVSDAVAVLWAPAGLIHEPGAFAEQARQSSRSSLPLYLWIDFRVRRHEDGSCEVFTTGLKRFGKREIELPTTEAAPQQVLQWVYNFAHYLLDREAAVKDGDTIGLPDESQFTVRHAMSRIDGTTPVLVLTGVAEP